MFRCLGLSTWATAPASPVEEPGSQPGLTRGALVVGPDQILGLHHDHGEALGRGEVAEREQDLPYSVGGLGGRWVAQRASIPSQVQAKAEERLPSPLRSCCSRGPSHLGSRLVGLRKGPPSPLREACTGLSSPVWVLPRKEGQMQPPSVVASPRSKPGKHSVGAVHRGPSGLGLVDHLLK